VYVGENEKPLVINTIKDIPSLYKRKIQFLLNPTYVWTKTTSDNVIEYGIKYCIIKIKLFDRHCIIDKCMAFSKFKQTDPLEDAFCIECPSDDDEKVDIDSLKVEFKNT